MNHKQKQVLRRVIVNVFVTLVMMPAALILPVFIADLILDLRGVPGPRDFDGLIWSSFFVGFGIAIVVGLVGLRRALRIWAHDLNNAGKGQACMRCGYSLQGLEGKAVSCPECGYITPRPLEEDKGDQHANQ